jgi:hypothetical protein
MRADTAGSSRSCRTGNNPGNKLSATEANSGQLEAALRRRKELHATRSFRLGAGRSQVQILSPRLEAPAKYIILVSSVMAFNGVQIGTRGPSSSIERGPVYRATTSLAGACSHGSDRTGSTTFERIAEAAPRRLRVTGARRRGTGRRADDARPFWSSGPTRMSADGVARGGVAVVSSAPCLVRRKLPETPEAWAASAGRHTRNGRDATVARRSRCLSRSTASGRRSSTRCLLRPPRCSARGAPGHPGAAAGLCRRSGSGRGEC